MFLFTYEQLSCLTRLLSATSCTFTPQQSYSLSRDSRLTSDAPLDAQNSWSSVVHKYITFLFVFKAIGLVEAAKVKDLIKNTVLLKFLRRFLLEQSRDGSTCRCQYIELQTVSRNCEGHGRPRKRYCGRILAGILH